MEKLIFICCSLESASLAWSWPLQWSNGLSSADKECQLVDHWSVNWLESRKPILHAALAAVVEFLNQTGQSLQSIIEFLTN